jgi:ElaB/YqjD/DUF883 family membrane-anchored ribosome-binding protein
MATYDTTSSDPLSGGGASSTADQAKEKAQDVAHQAAGQARGRLRDQVDQRSTQAGQQVTSTADDIRTIGEQLREQGKEQPAKLADQAAQRVQQVGDYLSRSDAETILHDVENIARRQPWAVVFGGATLGFLASRFLKASSSRRYEQRSSSGDGYSSRRQLPPATGSTVATTPGVTSGGVGAGYGGERLGDVEPGTAGDVPLTDPRTVGGTAGTDPTRRL